MIARAAKTAQPPVPPSITYSQSQVDEIIARAANNGSPFKRFRSGAHHQGYLSDEHYEMDRRGKTKMRNYTNDHLSEYREQFIQASELESLERQQERHALERMTKKHSLERHFFF